ncbi:MAG: CPBP family intramembrane metalloprotease [Lewinellaceae bacterium]|nr:CPBP family intramembrane metalloprotease [Lewinellaceae bacterium]
MQYPIVWEVKYTEYSLALILFMAGFLFWFYGSRSKWLNQRLSGGYGEDRGQAYQVLLKRFMGFLFYGIIPATVLLSTQPYGWKDYGVSARIPAEAWYWILILSPVLAGAAWIGARKPDSRNMYPEIRLKSWNWMTFTLSILGWAVYMLGYEFMFRGFLLFAGARALGAWPAILISTILYVLIHVPKNKQEAIGAIPLGVLLCIITFRTGSIFVPVVVHTTMAIANNWFSLKFHPEMQLEKRWSR